jgi:hypothetical protein
MNPAVKNDSVILINFDSTVLIFTKELITSKIIILL